MEAVNRVKPGNRKFAYDAGAIALLSLLDALLTDFGLRQRHIEEANPIALALYEWNVGAFYIWKAALPLLLLAVYPRISRYPYILRFIRITAWIYVLVTCIHLIWIAGIGR